MARKTSTATAEVVEFSKEKFKNQWIDGLSSTKSYRVIAARKTEEVPMLVVVRPLGESLKVKFYPNNDAWSVPDEWLQAQDFHGKMERPHYIRFICNERQLHKLFSKLNKNRHATDSSFEELFDSMSTEPSERMYMSWEV